MSEITNVPASPEVVHEAARRQAQSRHATAVRQQMLAEMREEALMRTVVSVATTVAVNIIFKKFGR
jgi:hypothetical protein